MLVEVPAASREVLRPLFADCPALRGAVDAVLDGHNGRAFADDPLNPALAVLSLDVYVVAGLPSASRLSEVLSFLPSICDVTFPAEWHAPLFQRCAANLTPYDRWMFRSALWDRTALQRFIDSLPAGYKLERINDSNIEAFLSLGRFFIVNYESAEAFLAQGAGFGIEHDGVFVAGCTSYTLSSQAVEFEIYTHPGHRRRGLAQAVASALILYCLDSGLDPCWDAANAISTQLATKLGFRDARQYTAFKIHPVLVETS
jgi:GNAT superfamily N-acetyltransferase